MSGSDAGAMQRLLRVGWLLVFVLAAAVPLLAQEDVQNPEYVKKVVRHLAAENRAGALYLFLETQLPEFSSVLKKAGLKELLDGQRSMSEFENAWRVQKAIYQSEGGRLSGTALQAMYEAFSTALMSRPATPPPAGQRVSDVLEQADRLSWIRRRMYAPENHPMTGVWDKMKRVEVSEVPGKLLWFNPDVAIPELGIRPGVPLTEEQKRAVEKLFSIRVSQEVPGNAKVGTAVYPSDVGRSVNVAPKSVTIIDGNSGDLLGEMVLKGTGLNPTTQNQRIWNSGSPIGHMETDEGLTDAELATRLRRLMVRAYAPIAVIDVSEQGGSDMTRAGRSVFVRASETFVRWSPHLDGDTSGARAKDAKTLLEYVAREAGLNEAGRPFSVAEWAAEYFPRYMGRNAGITAELGFSHTNHNGNIGPGEVMDFGEGELFKRRTPEGDVSWYKTCFEGMLRVANGVLPEGQKVNMQQATERFTLAVAEGREIVRRSGTRLRVSERYVPRLDSEQLDHLLGGYKDWVRYGLVDSDSASRLARDGGADFRRLQEEFARWGLTMPANKKPTAKYMADAILAEFSRRGGTPEGLRDVLRVAGGVEDTAAIERLSNVPLEELRRTAAARGLANAERFNQSQLARWVAAQEASAPVVAQTNRASRYVRAEARTQAKGAGAFAGAFLMKEGIRALETRDPVRMEQAGRAMATAEFWGGLGIFTAASHGTMTALTRSRVANALPKRAHGVARATLPLTAGMAALEASTGHVDPRRLAVTTGSFLAASAAVQMGTALVDPLVSRALQSAGTPGRVASGAYQISKLAAMLYLGERIDEAATSALDGPQGGAGH